MISRCIGGDFTWLRTASLRSLNPESLPPSLERVIFTIKRTGQAVTYLEVLSVAPILVVSSTSYHLFLAGDIGHLPIFQS
jgi:hypothetical protein